MLRKVKLLSRLENKNGKKWLDFYEENTYKTPSYYYTCHNGGKRLGADKTAAAAEVVKVAQLIGGLRLIKPTPKH